MDLHFYTGGLEEAGGGEGVPHLLLGGSGAEDEEGPANLGGLLYTPQHLYNGYGGSGKFPGENDSFLTITESGHPFLTGAETFHTPNLGDEEFEIPPISLDSDPTLAVSDVVGHFDDLGDPSSPHDGSFSAQYGVQTLEMPVGLEQGGSLLGSTLSMDMDHSVVTPYNANPPVTIDVSMSDMSSSLLSHSQLTTIDQSELSSQLGMGLGGGTILPPAPSPEERLSTTPSPTSSLHDDDMEDFKRITAPKAVVMGPTKKQKSRKKKDPNEPQKPVSAYALFFRDTQAAIKGQNPHATFGEVSKIVASMWDSLGEEQKQVYKRKTEAAKKEYLKALAAYKANQLSQTAVETVELESPQPSPQVVEAPRLSPPIVVTSSLPQYTTVTTVTTQTPASTKQPAITKIIISKLALGQLSSSIVRSQGAIVSESPATIVTARGLQGLQLGQQLQFQTSGQVPSTQAQMLTRSVLQAVMQLPPRLQPPPLQQMQQPPRLQQMPQVPQGQQSQPGTTMQPPPLQAMQKVRLNLQCQQPPPLQIKIIPPQPPLQPQPPPPPPLQSQTVQIEPTPTPVLPVAQPVETASPVPSPEPMASPERVEMVSEVVQEVESPPQQMEVQLISSSPPTAPEPNSPEPRCVRFGCGNPPVESKDWDNEYCSNECVAKHCRDVFMDWVLSRSHGTTASVK